LRRVDENLAARTEHAPAAEVQMEPDVLVPAAVKPPVSPGDETLVIGTGPDRRRRWRRLAAFGGVAAAVAVVALIPLRLQYNDANATRGAAAGSPPVVAVAPMPEPPVAVEASAAPQPPAAAPAAPDPKKKPAPPRAARKPPPEPPPLVVEAPPPPPPVAVAAAPPPAPAPPQTATLMLTVSPWGEIYIDGKRRGLASPVATIELTPGRHRVEIRNASQPSYLANVTVQAGDTQQLTHRFD
jgi:hypothetical protein